MLRNFDDPKSTKVRALVVALGITDNSELRPALELAKGLDSQKGVTVEIATHNRFRTQVKDLGLSFEDVGLDPIEARKRTKSGKDLESNKHDPSSVGIALKSFMDTLINDWCKIGLNLLVNGPGGPDIVILSSQASIYCYLPICEEHFIQTCILSTSPCIPTMSFPPPKAFRGVNAMIRESTCTGQWAIYYQSLWRFLYKDSVDSACMELFKGVPQTSPFGPIEILSQGSANSNPLILHAYSDILLPKPNDWSNMGNNSQNHIIGQISGILGPLPEKDFHSTCLSSNLLDFFAMDPESLTILIDLGPSFLQWQDDASRSQLLKQCVKSVTSIGMRAILVAPASFTIPTDDDDDNDGSSYIIIPAIPLGSEHVLCRKCGAIIFTGDINLAHYSLRSGTPLITLTLSGLNGINNEHTAENEFWGNILSLRNLSPKPMEASSITISLLSKLLKEVLNIQSSSSSTSNSSSSDSSIYCKNAKYISGLMSEAGCDNGAKAIKLIMDIATPIASIRSAGAKF